MAISLDLNISVYGQTITIKDAYIKVEKVEGNKDNVLFTLNSYTKDNKFLVNSEIYSFVPDAQENSLRWDKQAYKYLKTLEKFANCKDI